MVASGQKKPSNKRHLLDTSSCEDESGAPPTKKNPKAAKKQRDLEKYLEEELNNLSPAELFQFLKKSCDTLEEVGSCSNNPKSTAEGKRKEAMMSIKVAVRLLAKGRTEDEGKLFLKIENLTTSTLLSYDAHKKPN